MHSTGVIVPRPRSFNYTRTRPGEGSAGVR